MNAEMKADILRQVVFMQMIEALQNYQKHGILEEVTKQKKQHDLAEGPEKVKRFNIESPEAFLKFSSDVFNCVEWQIDYTDTGFTSTTHSCVACHMANEIGAPAPCDMHCINPFLAVLKGGNPDAELEVLETLREGEKCLFNVTL